MVAAPPVLFLMGPTAVGKTDVAVAIAQQAPVSIISVDSAMVYRGLDIGAGKPDAATLARAPHELIDIREIGAPYSAAAFRADALACIERSRARGRIPLLVGGTGLYFRALRHGLSPLPRADEAVRRALEREAAQVGWAEMHRRLAAVDPAAAARIRPSDPQRIQRALEVHRLTGTPMSALQHAHGGDACPFPVIAVSLEPGSRSWLHERIARRFHAMLDAGLVGEVRRLRERADFDPALPAMRAVGYRQVIEYLDGVLSHDEMVARAIIATRQLARRQLTWLRGEDIDCRVEAEDRDRLARVASVFGRAWGSARGR